MSGVAARLFSRLQDAVFYRRLHEDAASLLGAGGGRTWLDVGCGPGLLTRIAAGAGYEALGIDRDAAMIDAARRVAGSCGVAARFEQADLATLAGCEERFDVVSASSLLVVVPDPAAALRDLMDLTKPGGAVLIVEAAEAMSLARAGGLLFRGELGRGGVMAVIWASVRSGRTLDRTIFDQPDLLAVRRPLISGLVEAIIVRRQQEGRPQSATFG